MARDGYPFIGISAFIAVLAGALGFRLESVPFYSAAGVFLALSLFFAYFFRDPEREDSGGESDIISPGDGYVVSIAEVDEQEFFKCRTRRISIFLTVFDVHVNRIPISGTVEYLNYRPGTFKAAFKEDASAGNEQTVIGIINGTKKVLFKQIAGLLARRIVCNLTTGQNVGRGMRFGMIRFGSRIDVFIPLETELLVSKGMKVYGGTTILGRFPDEE